jgi:hypothetical protein
VAISIAQLIPGPRSWSSPPRSWAAEVAERAAIAVARLLMPDGTTMQIFGEGVAVRSPSG